MVPQSFTQGLQDWEGIESGVFQRTTFRIDGQLLVAIEWGVPSAQTCSIAIYINPVLNNYREQEHMRAALRRFMFVRLNLLQMK